MNIKNLFSYNTTRSEKIPTRPVHNAIYAKIVHEHNSMSSHNMKIYNLFRHAYRAGNIKFVKRTEYPSIRHQMPTPVEYVFFSPMLGHHIYIRETYPCQNVGTYMIQIDEQREAYFDKYNLAAMRAARLIDKAQKIR